MAEVEVYTNRGCPACVNVKQFLDRKGINYTEKQLGKSKKVDIEFSVRTKGAKQIPQVFINDEWIGGFDDVVRYDQAGELDWRLGIGDKPNLSVFRRIIRYLKGDKY